MCYPANFIFHSVINHNTVGVTTVYHYDRPSWARSFFTMCQSLCWLWNSMKPGPWLYLTFSLAPWRWRQWVLPKRRFMTAGILYVVYQKTLLRCHCSVSFLLTCTELASGTGSEIGCVNLPVRSALHLIIAPESVSVCTRVSYTMCVHRDSFTTSPVSHQWTV